jgi:hypothetical protein
LIEHLSFGLIYSLLKDSVHALCAKRRHLTNSERLELRQKWKPQFEGKIWETHRHGLRKDVILRDMRRLDNYPELEDKKGISPWFRAGLVGTYHRGILVGLGRGTLTNEKEKGWRFTDYSAGEQGDLEVALIGRIPYENIDNVDWDGDEYYGFPHIYCFFVHHSEPYEHTGFYIEKTCTNALPNYQEVASYRQVRQFSRKFRAKHFM